MLFLNSPPVAMTANGIAKGGKSTNNYNLKNLDYSAFARHMATVVKHFKDVDGIEFSYISPINEPQHDWSTQDQEGAWCPNNQQKSVCFALNNELATQGLSTKVMLTEAASVGDILGTSTAATPSGSQQQLDYMFNSTDVCDLRNLPNIPKELAYHSYWNDTNNKSMSDQRKQAAQEAAAIGVSLHQSEWCALSGPADGMPADYAATSNMDMGMYVAKMIYADLNYANAISWCFWTTMDQGYPSRFHIVRLTPTGATPQDGGTAEATKAMWTLGNYSRFVRPGYQRVELTGLTKTDGAEMSDLMAMSFLSPDNSKLVVVVNNMAYANKSTSINIPTSISGKTYLKNRVYVTDIENSLSLKGEINPADFIVNSRSVETIVFYYGEDTDADAGKLIPVNREQLATFEDETIDKNPFFLDMERGQYFGVITSPVKDEINNSNKCIRYVTLSTRFSSNVGVTLRAKEGVVITAPSKQKCCFAMKVLYDNPLTSITGFTSRFQFYDENDQLITEKSIDILKSSAWQEISIDVPELDGKQIEKIKILPDAAANRNATFYYDDFTFKSISTGLKQQQNSNIKIYSVQDGIQIENVEVGSKLMVYNLLGRLINTLIVKDNTLFIPTKDPIGILSVTDKIGNIYTKKFINFQ